LLGNISSKPDEKCVGKLRQAVHFLASGPVWRAPREFLRSACRDVNKHLMIEKSGRGKAGAGNKPGSVEDNHSSATAVTGCLKQPTREPARNRRHARALLPYLVLLRAGFAMPRPVTSRAVRSYRTFSPFPACVGGIFSVALSMGSRPPGVTWRPVRRSPDFPPPARANSDCLADSCLPGPRILPEIPAIARQDGLVHDRVARPTSREAHRRNVRRRL
jgi:hypothetical protein